MLSWVRRTAQISTVAFSLINFCLGHKHAFEAGILHRDVSDTNVLITDDPSKPFRGFITDFDLAVLTDDVLLTDEDEQSWTGTLRFIAIEQLGQRGIPHAVRHDLESFYWVLISMVLQYTVKGKVKFS